MATNKKLTPPDTKQCQADFKKNNPFTLGGKPKWVRCANTPTVIAYETKEGSDGLKGSMSLCDGCMEGLKNLSPDHIILKKIKKAA